MREDQIDQAERRATLDNDLKVLRERGGTFFQHGLAQANDMAGGRFAAVNTATVTGTTPIPNYPAASAAHQTQLPDEPPLGFDNPELESPTGVPPVSPPVATGDPADAPSSGSGSAPPGDLMSERAGSPPSSPKELDNGAA